MDELKPCPFCGEQPQKDIYKYIGGLTVYRIRCKNKFCLVKPFTNLMPKERLAIIAWNKRVDE